MEEKPIRNTERATFAADETVFHEGEFAMCAYIVESGRLDVLKDAYGGAVRVNTLGPGELFGEMALIGDSKRTATVTATEDTVLLVVKHTALIDKLDAADPVLRRLVKVLIARLRNQTAAHAEEIGALRAR